ncbi:MAG: DUF3168 domain-containing protein [Planctomycetaceae bacterium]|nr:DUF3168 domain-containing protein [Planctomycetaceae bacterium]
MSLVQAIYERWQADPRLTALIPPARVYSGRAAGDAVRPYAVIGEAPGAAARHTTHVAIESVAIELTAWSDDPRLARALLDEWRRVFERQAFPAGGARCLLMQAEMARVIAPDDSGWQAAARYRVLVERPAES